MVYLGFFSEMKLYEDIGSVQEYISNDVNYDKEKVIKYLSGFKKDAICPRYAIDCVTKEPIKSSFSVFNDGEYKWCDFLIYHIEKYNIVLPDEFIHKIGAEL